MSEWAHGYNVSQGYTHGFYPEMGPDWLDFCILASGSVPPPRGEDGGFRYLDLGCGQGFGVCVLAAANPAAEFVGIDFIAEHIDHANALAAEAGLTNVRFIEGDFMELAKAWPADLAQFDYTVLHGIYSWIAPQVREALVQCLAACVAPGGALYNGYNAQPGWTSTMPFRHMAKRIQEVTRKGDDDTIEAAVGLFEDIFENSQLGDNLPMLKTRITSVKNTPLKAYLAQEYLNGWWQPFWFSEVAGELGAIQFDYVGTATAIEQLLPGILPPDARKLVTSQRDAVFAQEVLDCLTAKTFRRDIYRRQARRVQPAGQDPLMDTPFHRAAGSIPSALTIKTTLGEMVLPPELFGPILEALGAGSATLGELAALPAFQGDTRDDVIQAVMMMLQAGLIAIAPRTAVDPEPARRFNAAVTRLASQGAAYRHIALPGTASGAQVSNIDCLLLDSYFSAAEPDHVAVAEGLYQRLQALGVNLVHEGQPLEGDAAAQRIVELADIFVTNDLPRWLRLGAVA